MKAPIKNTIHIERAKKGITQQELADGVGTTRQTIHLLEVGKTDPKISLMVRIAHYFKLKVSDIIDD